MESTLKCPYCSDFDCVHFEAIQLNRGGEITTVDCNGTRLQSGEPAGRGARIEIILWCEQGHKWRRSMQFHKGQILIEDELLHNGCPNCSQGRDLWRD